HAVHAAPDDGELVEQALASASSAGTRDGLAIELLRAAIPPADAATALTLRHRLVTALLERGDATSHELGRAELRALVREHPESRELALELSRLEHHDGRPEEAATLLGTLAEGSADEEDRARLRLEQARLLAESEQPRRAWAGLQGVLERPPPGLEVELLELAITIAPLSVRDRLIDRLAEID